MERDAKLESVVALYGATAVGKTAVAVQLATLIDAEIICADAYTVYRGLDIATAKPTARERAQVPHHLLDVAEPTESVTVGEFKQLALDAIADIGTRGKRTVIVGGAGLHLFALLDNWRIPAVPPNPELRQELLTLEALDPGCLYRRLEVLEPMVASRMHPANTRRIVRALEVASAAGGLQLPSKDSPLCAFCEFGLRAERSYLDATTAARIDAMVEGGLEDEVRRLIDRGVRESAPAMQGIGYREFWMYLNGAICRTEAIDRMKARTRRLIRKQEAWFKRRGPAAWIDVSGKTATAIASEIHEQLLTSNEAR